MNCKKLSILVLAISMLIPPLFGLEYATTDSGDRVILFDNGLWEFEYTTTTEESNPLGVTETTPSFVSKWHSSVKIDPIDDSRVASYILQADSGESVWGDPIYLIIRETDGFCELYINWDDYLGSDEVTVTHRVGTRTPVVQSWELSTDNQASFYPWNGEPDIISLLVELMSADQFIARCTPYNENPITAIFDIRGLAQEMAANLP